ncbi:MAG: hypothetical protein PHG11_06795 [Eubacteriales bacterium]|jgi:hypothetical protein|nr:hypothetical protein [Eubacteriales bacterium]
MKRESPHLARVKGRRLPDRNACWLAAFAATAVLALVLAIIVKPWLLKVLFVLVMIGAVLYCWLMIQDRRNMPKPAPEPLPRQPKEDPGTGASPETEEPEPDGEPGSVDGQEVSGELAVEASSGLSLESALEGPQADEQSEPPVLVSDKGDKYHRNRKCQGLRFANSLEEMPEAEAEALGRKPCGICWPKGKED